MNKVFLSGNLTRDPELRYAQSGKAFVRVGIAVRRTFSKDKEAVDFFNLVAFDKTAEFIGRYFVKGARALIEGRLQTSSYENKDGVKINAVDVLVDNIEFASSRRSESDDYSGGGRGANDNYLPRREPTPPKREDYDDFGGEPIDPDDTPF